MKTEFDFTFGEYSSKVLIQDEYPSIKDIYRGASDGKQLFKNCSGADDVSREPPALLVCDVNTESIARKILEKGDSDKNHLLVLENGENAKSWKSVELILKSGRDAGLGRDGLFIGVGGGVISDITAFAASIYMRGARLCLVSTTLLGMVDAALGGKTGIDLLGLKNLAGTFYPAFLVILPLAALTTLPEREWKSGMAELIKTAVLDSQESLSLVKELIDSGKAGRDHPSFRKYLKECISMAIAYKGRIVTEDPRESGNERALLNLGHTFGHALESALGLGAISHGEAVAWGMLRACELGLALGITPAWRALEISEILRSYGYETGAPHPNVKSFEVLMAAIMADKKQKDEKIRFIVPSSYSAQIVEDNGLIEKILKGESPV